MTSIILQPNRHGRPGGIWTRDLIASCLGASDPARKAMKSDEFVVYGKDPQKPRDLAGWHRLSAGDPVLFYHDRRYFARARVVTKFVSTPVARVLWPEEKGRRDHIIMFDQVRLIDLPAARFHAAIGYASRHVIQGFTVLDPQKSRRGMKLLSSIRSLPRHPGSGSDSAWEFGLDSTPVVEGRQQLAAHMKRERNRAVVIRKKESVLRLSGRLQCEACGFDFKSSYPWLELDWCEVHHNRPIGQASVHGQAVALADLSILCANCHRMIHRCTPMPTVRKFRQLLARGA